MTQFKLNIQNNTI